jgi:hypothetical protein
MIEPYKSAAESMIEPQKAACMDKLQSVYLSVEGKWSLVKESSQYTRTLAAYERTVAQCEGLRDCAVASVAFTKSKIAVLYTDGAVALMDNLRNEGYLPANGDFTLQKLMNRSQELATQMIELAQTAPSLALQRAQELYEQLLKAIKEAPALAQGKLETLLTLSQTQLTVYQQYIQTTIAQLPEQLEQLKLMIAAKAQELVELARKSPELAKEQLTKLYALLCELNPNSEQFLESLTSSPAYSAVVPKAQEQLNFYHQVVTSRYTTAKQTLVAKAAQVNAVAASLTEKTFDAVAPHVIKAIKTAPYGETAFTQLGKGLEATPVWSWLPSKVTEMFPQGQAVSTEPVVTVEEDDILFSASMDVSATSDPLAESSKTSEDAQEALYSTGEQLFQLCKSDGDTVTKSAIKNLAKREEGQALKELFSQYSVTWADWWELIEAEEDGTFSQDAFASAYAQLAYSQ